jgi:hypothetical protein
MDCGLTIAPITKKGASVENHRNFGDRYWDDGQYNKSRVGYYFAYYYQKKFVELRQIINILKPSEKPKEMADWVTTRNILCLGPLLKKFTWEDWKNNWGYTAPFSKEYGSINTNAWTYENLSKDYPKFNFNALIKFIGPLQEEPKPILVIPLVKESPTLQEKSPTVQGNESVKNVYQKEFETKMKEMEQKLREECEQKIKEACIRLEHELKIKSLTEKFNLEIEKVNEEFESNLKRYNS